MANNDFKNGVWRTIGGHKVFIKDGEDLGTAMKKSGKFKKSNLKNKNSKEEFTEEQRKKKIVHLHFFLFYGNMKLS